MPYQGKQGHEDRRKAEKLELLLARHEAELTARKRLLRPPLASEAPGPVESRPDASAHDVGAALVEVSARTVRSIEGALRRLKSGAYGTCLDCGSPIPALRLQALPFAERCRDCQERHDPGPRPTLGGPPAMAG